MAYEFRPAVRENVGLLIGLAAPSGAGKTMSAMKIAKGICGDKPFAVIDTEARRSLHYADMFRFDFLEITSPFSSDAYREAITAAEAQGYGAIVIDSFSHEHDGEGGMLDMQERELEELVSRAKDRGDTRKEWELEEAYKRSAWIKPKRMRKRLMQKLLQCRSHLIFCLRAEDKIDFVKDPKTKKTTVVPMETLSGYKGWIPICDKKFPFELTASFILLPDKPGIPVPIKLQEQHKPFFPLDKPLSEETGRLIAEWAKGGNKTAPKVEPAKTTEHFPECTVSDFQDIENACKRVGVTGKQVKEFVISLGFDSYGSLTQDRKQTVLDWVNAQFVTQKDARRG